MYFTSHGSSLCVAPSGMRVKLSRIPKALKARCSKVQGGGARSAGSGTLGFRMELRFSLERATQYVAIIMELST